MPKLKTLMDFWSVKSPEGRRAAEAVGYEYDLPGRPELSWPTLPDRPTAISDELLVDLLADYNTWIAHISGQRFLQEVDVRYWERMVVETESRSVESAFQGIGGRTGSDSSVTRARALRDIDPRTVKVHEELRDSKSKRDALEYLYNTLEKDSWMLSRELTRRLGREGRDTRPERYRT